MREIAKRAAAHDDEEHKRSSRYSDYSGQHVVDDHLASAPHGSARSRFSPCVLLLQRLQPLDHTPRGRRTWLLFIDAVIAAAVFAAKLEDSVPLVLRATYWPSRKSHSGCCQLWPLQRGERQVARWQITRKRAKVNRNMKFSPKETATAAVPNSSRKSRSVWNGAILAATVIALVATVQVWVAGSEKSSCRIFADGTFYCWDKQPPLLARRNDQYHDCAYERGKISSDCVAWYAKHLDHHLSLRR
ncbi:hypothetical protein GR247_39865 [Rhizobium leguminosarum]|uniref:Uncharacterized protein n=1 Tax=Rhizobium leguminosarum TaxID=384 RepID=A0A6P0C509_RHILE|nr:hypothetical protein [Rhizobium leguminosarum]MBY5325415.1 hypothetical protein [Rhizobium leguminosarum]NEI96267.1 hypothetical protein [Rhizobium leguminosarum]NEJ26108.1 hypothetical protein [Rhizobium leguminosarum]NEJ82394.1 hypothetical protein [Rhizobium leguminosarum]NEK54861.1 hypothetical protein [Rhizobium leguminosarum]